MSLTDRGTPSRRSVLGGAVVASVTAPFALSEPAEAASTTYKPAHHRGARLLSRQDRHLVSRFSYGVTPALASQVRAAGGARRWFEDQLSPASITDPGIAPLRDWWGPGLSLPAAKLWERQVTGVEGGWEVMANYARWAMLRRIKSRRQVQEVMAEFWENHFNVPVNGDAAFTWRTDLGVTLRSRALTSFETLLKTATTHPAMSIYLDNAVNTKAAPNENLGRELLELHTVGRKAGYSEDDVKNSARILTGYRVKMWDTFAASYDESQHWTNPVRVMDFEHANASPDGRPVVDQYLTYLARHPKTAERIARKLCVKFVSDNPSDELVARLAAVYLAHDTEIKPVLRALVDSAEFRSSIGKKVRDPGEDIVATYRLIRVTVSKPGADAAAANAILWQTAELGSSPFSWPRPDGQPVDNDSWSSPARMLASMHNHYTMAGGWWPSVGIRYRSPKSWAGLSKRKKKIRFNTLVDKMSQEILHQRSTPALLEACCAAVDTRPRAKIKKDHPVMRWNFPRLLTTFLDSPYFYLR
jgi:hypothetical protein